MDSRPTHSRPAWLDTAVFYEIYPQSFADANGDGIGDIAGITARLDYIQDLGCNAIWLNPCFDSPFKDAGYDVRDYRLVAPPIRYERRSDRTVSRGTRTWHTHPARPGPRSHQRRARMVPS